MQTSHPELSVIQDKFPWQRASIEELYNSNPDFRSLCEDYFLCMNALEKYQKEPGNNEHAIKEYDDLRKELEKEIEDFIYRQK